MCVCVCVCVCVGGWGEERIEVLLITNDEFSINSQIWNAVVNCMCT